MRERAVVATDQAPAPFEGAPFSQAIRFGELVFVSGQIGNVPETGGLVAGGIAEQTEQVLANVRAILAAAGSRLDNLLKATVYLDDFDDFAAMNEVYRRHVGDRPPARATVEVSRLPAGGAGTSRSVRPPAVVATARRDERAATPRRGERTRRPLPRRARSSR